MEQAHEAKAVAPSTATVIDGMSRLPVLAELRIPATLPKRIAILAVIFPLSACCSLR
jgi:hypothetical protein